MKAGIKKQVVLNLPLLVFVYVGNKISWLYRMIDTVDISKKVYGCLIYFSRAFRDPFPSFHATDIAMGILCAVAVKLVLYWKSKNTKKYRQGVEYGSARWGIPSDITPYMDSNPRENMIFSQTEGLRMNGRPKNLKYARNTNVLVVGGSGSGKTRFFVEPNIMQMNSSYVITDPKGTILPRLGHMLVKHGYQVKVLNTINFSKSMHYNPFQYIHSEKDILKLVNVIIENTKGERDKSGEDFWVKAERLLYQAYIGYIWYEAPEEENNMQTLLEMINESETREDDENFKNAVDLLFEELEGRKPEHFAVKQYKKYKLAAGKTAKSILISCGARLAAFDIQELRNLMSYDELEFDKLGDRKTALFIITSDTDSTFDFVTAVCCSQLFNVLCTKADDEYNGSLPVHVQFLLDEFANIKIPNIQRLIAVIRSRNMGACLIVQAKSQLKGIYKDHADAIEGNCDTTIFLGGKDGTTLKELSEILGKETIDLSNTSDTRGSNRSYGINYQKAGKDLMSRDELSVMDGEECIVQVRGVRPFLSKKYDIKKHERYKELSESNPKYTFDAEKYMKHRLILKKNEQVEVYEITL